MSSNKENSHLRSNMNGNQVSKRSSSTPASTTRLPSKTLRCIDSNQQTTNKKNVLKTRRPKRSTTSTLGYLSFLPTELQYKLFRHYLGYEGMARLACCSHAANQLIWEHLQSPVQMRHIASTMIKPHNDIHLIRIQDCRRFGRFLRKLIIPNEFTKERIQTWVTYCIQVAVAANPAGGFKERHIMREVMEDTSLPSLGQMVLGYIITAVMQDCGYLQRVELVRVLEEEAELNGYPVGLLRLTPLPDRATPEELMLRRLYRGLLIEPNVKDKDRGQWLTVLMHQLSSHHRVKLLFILFGPVINGLPLWHLLPHFDTEAAECQVMVVELAGALRSLHTVLLSGSMLHLILRLTSLPEDWDKENVAALLLYAGQEVTALYLEHLVYLCKYDRSAPLPSSHVFGNIEVSSPGYTRSMEKLIITFRELNNAYLRFRQDLYGYIGLPSLLLGVVAKLGEEPLQFTFVDSLQRDVSHQAYGKIARIIQHIVDPADIRVRVLRVWEQMDSLRRTISIAAPHRLYAKPTNKN